MYTRSTQQKLINMSPLISVIVPVYNAEQSLKRCIDSVLRQSYLNWELLLIDDGSVDSSGKICNDYATKYDNVKVFHKNNGGVSSARNVGLDQAVGEWITFLDSDDYIDVNFLSSFVKLESSDLSIAGIQFINSETTLLPPETYIKIDDVNKLDCLLNKLYFTVPWGKIYKNEIIQKNEIRFNTELKIGEDTDFVLKYLLYVNDIRIVSSPLYNFYNDEESKLLKYTLTTDEFIVHTTVIKDSLISLSDKLNYEFPITFSLLMRYYSHLFYVYLMSIQSYMVFKEEVRKYKKSRVDYYPKSLLNAFVMKLIKVFPQLIFILFRLLDKK